MVEIFGRIGPYIYGAGPREAVRPVLVSGLARRIFL
jgi:hypothetical protein